MSRAITQHFGQCLSLVAGALTASFQAGSPVSLEGTDVIDVPVAAAFDAATTLASIEFQLQGSNDLTRWDAIGTMDVSGGDAEGDLTFAQPTWSYAASAGNTVTGHLHTKAAGNFRYVRVAAKFTGGDPRAGDSATASLDYRE